MKGYRAEVDMKRLRLVILCNGILSERAPQT